MAVNEALPTASGHGHGRGHGHDSPPPSSVPTTPTRPRLARQSNQSNNETETHEKQYDGYEQSDETQTPTTSPHSFHHPSSPFNSSSKSKSKQRPNQTHARAQAHARSSSLNSLGSLSLHHVGLGSPTPSLSMSPSPLLRQLSSHFSSPSGPVDDELSDELSEGGSPSSGFGFGLGMGMDSGLGLGLGAGAGLRLGSVSADQGVGDEVNGKREKEGDDLTQDRRDVLVERLSDLIRRLQRVPPAEVLDELHGKVDEMETRMSLRGERRVVRSETTPETDQVGFTGVKRFRPEDLRTASDGVSSSGPGNVHVNEALPVGEPVPDEVTKRIIESAEALNARLVSAVLSLRVRKEESDHIHALLVERAEAAASRILELEQEVTELEDELGTNESDLRHLRLELRAVETLCHSSVQSGARADPELVRSIENWKADWARLREKLSANKKSRRVRRHLLCGDDGGEGEPSILTASFASISTIGVASPGV